MKSIRILLVPCILVLVIAASLVSSCSNPGSPGGGPGPGSPGATGSGGLVPEGPAVPLLEGRTSHDLTPVKAQGGTGGCWAFASIAALESHMAVVHGRRMDLSENNVMTQLSTAYHESYARDLADGGDDLMAAGYYTSLRGPVLEEHDPFPASLRAEDMAVKPGLKPALRVEEVLFLPERSGPLDNDLVKWAVKEFGGVAVAMWKGSPSTFGPYYNEETYAWYYNEPGPNEEGNGHAVTIVGWDDSFPKENFSITPPGDGAFIVRNTKGPDWGRPDGKESLGGYFCISYYDTMLMAPRDSLIGNHVFSRVSEAPKYDNLYQHDVLGYNYPLEVSSGGSKKVTYANVFRVANRYGEDLRAIGFYALNEDTEYEISVVTGFSGSASLNNRRVVAGGKLDLAGYYTVTLPEPVRLAEESWFAVVVSLSAPEPQAIATDSELSRHVKRTLSNTGESYVLVDGTWKDLHSLHPNTNVCVKAFTDNAPPERDLISSADMTREVDEILAKFQKVHPETKVKGFTPAQQEVIDSVKQAIASPMLLKDYYFQMQRLFAMMGDGHTVLHYQGGDTHFLDLPFQWLMDDGIVVSAGTSILRKGDRVLSIGGADYDELIRRLATITSHENEYRIRYDAPDSLTRARCLEYLGLVNPDRTVDVQVERDGVVSVYRLPLTTNRTVVQPAYVAMSWVIEEHNNLGYFRFDSFPHRDEMGPLVDQVDAFFEAVRREGVGNIVFDWRYNGGGFSPIMSRILGYLTAGPVYASGYSEFDVDRVPEQSRFTGKVYVMTSNGTYSAAVLASTMLHDNGLAVTLGEPTGENPAFNRNGGEGGGDLPVTGWHYMLVTATPERPRSLPDEPALFPDIPVHTSALDLIAGRDIQLERLREITAGREWRYPDDTIIVDAASQGGSLRVQSGASDSFNLADKTVTIACGPQGIQKVRLVRTDTGEVLKTVVYSEGEVRLPAGLEPGVTYHLVFETSSGTVAFLTSVLGERLAPGQTSVWPPYVKGFSYASRFKYFLITFAEPVKSYRTSGIAVLDSKGNPVSLRGIEVPSMDPKVLVIVTQEVVPKSEACVVILPPGAITLLDGTTNTNELRLGNYQYN